MKSNIQSYRVLYDDGQALFLKAKELGLEGICQYNPDTPLQLDTRSKNMVLEAGDFQFTEIHKKCILYLVYFLPPY